MTIFQARQVAIAATAMGIVAAPASAQLQSVDGYGFEGGPAQQLPQATPDAEFENGPAPPLSNSAPSLGSGNTPNAPLLGNAAIQQDRLLAAINDFGFDLAPEAIAAIVQNRFDRPNAFPLGRPFDRAEWLWSLVVTPDGTEHLGLGYVIWELRETEMGAVLAATGLSLEPQFGYELIIAPPGVFPLDAPSDFFVAAEFITTESDTRTIEAATVALSSSDLFDIRPIDAPRIDFADQAVGFLVSPERLFGPIDDLRASEAFTIYAVLDDGSEYVASLRLGTRGALTLAQALAAWGRLE